jgi:hypothetical protein
VKVWETIDHESTERAFGHRMRKITVSTVTVARPFSRLDLFLDLLAVGLFWFLLSMFLPPFGVWPAGVQHPVHLQCAQQPQF